MSESVHHSNIIYVEFDPSAGKLVRRRDVISSGYEGIIGQIEDEILRERALEDQRLAQERNDGLLAEQQRLAEWRSRPHFLRIVTTTLLTDKPS